MPYLTRNKIHRKRDPHKDAKKIYILCEGEKSEINYFKFFRGLVSNIDIIPIPNDGGKSDPVKLKEHARNLFLHSTDKTPKYTINPEYEDEVWFVIDTDRWNEKQKISDLRDFVQQNKQQYKGWFVAQSNPSFEIWYYYHFFAQQPNNEEVAEFSTFKEFVSLKIKGGFDNRKMPIEIQEAAKNARNTFLSEGEQPSLYSTEVFRLADTIIQFVEPELRMLRNALPSRGSD